MGVVLVTFRGLYAFSLPGKAVEVTVERSEVVASRRVLVSM